MRALALANEVRRARARARRRIADRELSASDVLLAPQPELQSLALIDLLRCQRGWGTVRARRFIARHELSERKPIGTLTDRQRRVLAASLRRHGPEPPSSAVEVNLTALRPVEGASLKPEVVTDSRESDGLSRERMLDGRGRPESGDDIKFVGEERVELGSAAVQRPVAARGARAVSAAGHSGVALPRSASTA